MNVFDTSMKAVCIRENVGHTLARVFVKDGENPMSNKQMYWFPAKRYGWGWGLPLSWHGWVVLAVFVGLLGVGFLIFSPNKELGPLLAYVALLSALLIAVCWLRGEPPRWRWGSGDGA